MVNGTNIELPREGLPLVSVLIAVLGKTELLVNCLQSLRRHLPRDVNLETIVVLAQVPFDEVTRLEASVSGATFVQTPVNLGMAGSINLARSFASGRYLVVLHDDAEIEPGWLEGLLAAAKAHPMAAAVGSKVLNFDGTLQCAGACVWQNGLTTLNSSLAPLYDPEIGYPVDYCGTSSLLVLAEAFDAIGGCDEAFFPAYYVDVNIALSLRLLRRYVAVAPSSVILHHRGGSSSASYRQYVSGRNHDLFLRKWSQMLVEFGPYPSTDIETATGNAVEKAAGFANSCAIAPTALPSRAFRFDQQQQRLRHLQLSESLNHDYAVHLERLLDEQRAQVSQRSDEADRRVADIMASTSWRLTAPLRWISTKILGSH